MRLDKFLKVSRIIKRRTVANEISNKGRVKVNGKQAKPSIEVNVGDTIEIAFGSGNVTVEVLQIKETVKKAEVSDLYRIVGNSAGETIEIDDKNE